MDSVDSLKLGRETGRGSAQCRKETRDVLIEVNVGGEAAKSGVALDSDELEDLLVAAPRLEALTFHAAD